MTSLPVYQVAAFANTRFGGNPAAVVLAEQPLSQAKMQAIARETAQPATAFLLNDGARWSIRWFTPTIELPLCGHATLAAAWVLLERIGSQSREIRLQTHHAGELMIAIVDGRLWLDFPADPPANFAATAKVEAILGVPCREVLQAGSNLLAIVERAEVVRQFAPNLAAIAELDCQGLIISAPGDESYDCVSRYFAPKKGVGEDAVTGSAHCALAPYWSARLGKERIRAWQASVRGGELLCEMAGSRVRLSGNCVPFLEGMIDVGTD